MAIGSQAANSSTAPTIPNTKGSALTFVIAASVPAGRPVKPSA
jgi:hypothetical protein